MLWHNSVYLLSKLDFLSNSLIGFTTERRDLPGKALFYCGITPVGMVAGAQEAWLRALLALGLHPAPGSPAGTSTMLALTPSELFCLSRPQTPYL